MQNRSAGADDTESIVLPTDVIQLGILMVSNKKQQGFTLIELVFVIVILGILAAFAVPRFVDLTSEARAAAIQGVGGSVQSAAALTHAQALVQNVTNGTIQVEGTSVTMVNGYPAGSTDGIVAALQSLNGYGVAVSGTTVTITPSGFSGSNCEVAYTQAAANSAPGITIDTNGC